MDSLEDYPDIDQVKWFIKNYNIQSINEAITETEILQIQKDTPGTVLAAQAITTTGSASTNTSTLASQVATAINTIINMIKDAYVLRTTAAPRYWKHNEPVIILAGDSSLLRLPEHQTDPTAHLLDNYMTSISPKSLRSVPPLPINSADSLYLYDEGTGLLNVSYAVA